jgi:integrase
MCSTISLTKRTVSRSGLRRAELYRLKVSDIDSERMVCTYSGATVVATELWRRSVAPGQHLDHGLRGHHRTTPSSPLAPP